MSYLNCRPIRVCSIATRDANAIYGHDRLPQLEI